MTTQISDISDRKRDFKDERREAFAQLPLLRLNRWPASPLPCRHCAGPSMYEERAQKALRSLLVAIGQHWRPEHARPPTRQRRVLLRGQQLGGAEGERGPVCRMAGVHPGWIGQHFDAIALIPSEQRRARAARSLIDRTTQVLRATPHRRPAAMVFQPPVPQHPRQRYFILAAHRRQSAELATGQRSRLANHPLHRIPTGTGDQPRWHLLENREGPAVHPPPPQRRPHRAFEIVDVPQAGRPQEQISGKLVNHQCLVADHTPDHWTLRPAFKSRKELLGIEAHVNPGRRFRSTEEPLVTAGEEVHHETTVTSTTHQPHSSSKVQRRFLSCEQLLGPLPSLRLDGIDWVIVGGESGPGFRALDLGWVREIRDRCVESGVALFFKQIGGRTPKARGRALPGPTLGPYPPPPPPPRGPAGFN